MKMRLTIQDYLDLGIIRQWTIKRAKIIQYNELTDDLEEITTCDYEHSIVESIIPGDQRLILYICHD